MSRTPRLVLATIALGVVAAAPCAHAQGLPPDPPLTPVADPTRVPIVVESAGPAQLASVVVQSYATPDIGYSNGGAVVLSRGGYAGGIGGGSTGDFYSMFHGSTSGLDTVALCWTPCTLYGHPGTQAALHTWGPGVGPGVVNLAIPREGMRLRLRAPSRGGFNGGVFLTTFGGFFALIGTGVLVGAPFVPTEYLGIMLGAGVGASLLGAALMVPGIFLIAANNPGVMSTTTLNGAPLPNPPEARPRLSMSWTVTPTMLPGGAGLAMLASF